MGQGFGGKTYLNDRRLSVVVLGLFSGWMLSVVFEGRILYALADGYGMDPGNLSFGAVAGHFAGLFTCGFFVRTMKVAKRLMLGASGLCLALSCAFFFPPSPMWTVAVIGGSLLAGGCVASWGFFFKHGTERGERIKTAADMMIASNALMILLNAAAIHLSAQIGLVLSMLMLLASFLFALRLPETGNAAARSEPPPQAAEGIGRALAFLCLFVVVISINSGLMYRVLNPAYAHLEWLASWYWAVPYIAAMLLMRNLPPKANRTYMLYVAVAMIGFSFIGFMSLGRSAASYLVVNTLMLGACGVYDLFWWSILGEMLDLGKNPASILGVGLSANVLGVLAGGLIGSAIVCADRQSPDATLLALAIVCVTLMLLPPLHKRLLTVLRHHAYLSALSAMTPEKKDDMTGRFMRLSNLSERESQVASLLLQAKTYRAIAGELHISENTVKYYVKNIYSKYGIQSRAELIDLVMKQDG